MRTNRKTLGACALLSCLIAGGVAYAVSTWRQKQLERLARAAAGESMYQRRHPRARV